MKLPSFECERPTALKEAIQMLADEKGAAKVNVGAQSLIPIQLQSHRNERYIKRQGMKAG
jgi:CO/xanthine dehydrogenase FAD-binding subunit